MILAFITYSMVVTVCQGARPSFYHQVGDTLYKNAYNGNGTLAALRGKNSSSFVLQFRTDYKSVDRIWNPVIFSYIFYQKLYLLLKTDKLETGKGESQSRNV